MTAHFVKEGNSSKSADLLTIFKICEWALVVVCSIVWFRGNVEGTWSHRAAEVVQVGS